MTKKKIILIDDDAELSEEMAELLEAEGYSVDSVSDGRKAVELVRKKKYDLYLLDFKMQGMTGLDVLKEVRKKNPKAAVFFVSGRPGLAALIEEGAPVSAVREIIEKPFDARVLLDKIRSCLAAA